MWDTWVRDNQGENRTYLYDLFKGIPPTIYPYYYNSPIIFLKQLNIKAFLNSKKKKPQNQKPTLDNIVSSCGIFSIFKKNEWSQKLNTPGWYRQLKIYPLGWKYILAGRVLA